MKGTRRDPVLVKSTVSHDNKLLRRGKDAETQPSEPDHFLEVVRLMKEEINGDPEQKNFLHGESSSTPSADTTHSNTPISNVNCINGQATLSDTSTNDSI